MTLLEKIFGSRSQKIIKKINPLIKKINALEDAYGKLSDSELLNHREIFIGRFKEGESLDDLLPEAFATVREVSKRQLGLRPYDCQLIGGVALHNCQIAEMATGEGKTLVATLPIYLNSITSRTVVLVTVNDYLAQRDANWMSPLYKNLGMSVSSVVSGQGPEDRQKSYSSDVIYATNNELGFDYLRNNMVLSKTERVMEDCFYAIVDEVDSILIDEARTPLVISGPAEDTSKTYQQISQFIPQLKQQAVLEEGEEITPEQVGDFLIDEKSKQVELTDKGHDRVESLLKQASMIEKDESLYSSNNLKLLHYIQSSLRAHFLFKKDIDYMLQDNQIVLIDENTGRAIPGRRLADGLHQAIEQKEGVPIQMESQTLASCTFQNYFRQFEKLSGMTGTATTESQEFAEIYGLSVLEVPTNKPMVRKDNNDLVYLTEDEKYDAVVKEIDEYKKKGNPVLVGTASLESSEMVSKLLKNKKIEHQVLNAKNHAREAEIISQAGKPNVVTIATNMAGRGTDIVLGGNWEAEFENTGNQDESIRKKFQQDWKKLNAKVIEAGGLHVIGTERNESRRMDNQLRGRSGRQGDPGSSRFYVSLEDNLMRIFASDQFKNIMERVGMDKGESIEHRMLTGAIERAQKRVEGRNFDIRKMLLEYDDMANEQRQIIYSQRNTILEADVITDLLDSMRENVIETEVLNYKDENAPLSNWNLEGIENSLVNIFGHNFLIRDWLREDKNLDEDGLITRIFNQSTNLYKEKGNNIGPAMRDFEKQILLQIIDNSWKDHLGAVDSLRQGIGLRSYGNKNPKLEFRRESFELFEALLQKIRHEGVRFLSRVEIETNNPADITHSRDERKETLHHETASAFDSTQQNPLVTNNQDKASSQTSGNRRLRRAEAKMARKNAKKKK
ncbi:preprotein translocase subunit SecA [Gammaproteobacteria bacterium]|nr:preprotein translocase subunit SecA [Gammaproteobacteria bacterium]